MLLIVAELKFDKSLHNEMNLICNYKVISDWLRTDAERKQS